VLKGVADGHFEAELWDGALRKPLNAEATTNQGPSEGDLWRMIRDCIQENVLHLQFAETEGEELTISLD
jgi:hypothetical protein